MSIRISKSSRLDVMSEFYIEKNYVVEGIYEKTVLKIIEGGTVWIGKDEITSVQDILL